jgi:hypothetical protein
MSKQQATAPADSALARATVLQSTTPDRQGQSTTPDQLGS